MDDDSFKTELLARLDRIQSLLTYLCGAAKASEERAKAGHAANLPAAPGGAVPPQITAEGRSSLQDEMQDDYQQAIQRWKQGKGA